MKIKVIKEEDVEISDKNARLITLNYLYKYFDWGPNYFQEDGNVSCIKEIHTSHASRFVEIVRKASDMDLAVHKIITKLKAN